MYCNFFIFSCRDDNLCGSELTSKLEPAFLAGLRCTQPQIRQKFVEVFDNSIKKRLFDRLLYMTCSQNWEAMGSHYWIKQCIEVREVDTEIDIDGLEQDCGNSIAIAMELLQSCAKPLIVIHMCSRVPL